MHRLIKTVGIVRMWYYVVAPATAIQEPNGRWVTDPVPAAGGADPDSAAACAHSAGNPEVLRDLRR